VAIVASDILFKLSSPTGPGNSTAQADPNDSLGRFMSSTQITDNSLHNLFDLVTGDQNAASEVNYRVFFVQNAHGSLTWESAVIYLSSEVAGGANIAMGLDTTGNVSATSASAQTVARPADETAAPSGITFSAPTTKGTGLSIGNLTAGQVRAIWVRRTNTNSSAVDNDGGTFTVSGDTAA
jgi:hypothetical protein